MPSRTPRLLVALLTIFTTLAPLAQELPRPRGGQDALPTTTEKQNPTSDSPGRAPRPASVSASGPDGSARMTGRFPTGLRSLGTQQKPPSRNWLLDADSDDERFRRLQIAAGGSDVQMQQVGLRFEELHRAVLLDNRPMADYHLGKIREHMQIMGLKRPNRTPNLEDMFLLSGAFEDLRKVIQTGTHAQLKDQFLSTRQVCMACHVAERMGFLNDGGALARTSSFPAHVVSAPR